MKVVVLLSLLVVGSCYTASVLGPIESLQGGDDGNAGAGKSDSKRLLAIGDAILMAMHDLLDQQEKSFHERLKRVEAFINHKCGSPQDSPASGNKVNMGDMQTTMSDILDGFMGKMSSLVQTYADDLRQEFRGETQQVIKMMKEEISALATKSDLHHLETRESANDKRVNSSDEESKIPKASAVTSLGGKESSLVAQSDLVQQLGFVNHQLAHIARLLGNVSFADILDYSRKTFKSMDDFQPLYDSLMKVVDKCEMKESQYYHLERLEKVLMHLTEEVDENGDALSSMTVSLEDAENMMIERLQTLEELTQELTKNMVVVAPITNPQPSSTPAPGTLSTCMDSLFVGAHVAEKSSNLCKTALRYDKCSLQIVAYHCCRTCTDAGHIPEIGPHRFLHYPRLVNLTPGR